MLKTYIIMLEGAEHLKFTIYTTTGSDTLKDIRKLLDGDPFSIAGIRNGPSSAQKNKQLLTDIVKIIIMMAEYIFLHKLC